MLYKSGAIKQKGNVEQGKAAMLTEPEEIQHHLAVTIHLGHLEWKNHAIYFVDTPGSFNFLESTRGVLPGIDGALFLFTGTEGVKPETERLWGMLEEAGIPCLGFINQIDDEQANLNTALSVIEQTLKRPVEPLSFPIRHKKQLIGMVDLLARKTRIVEGAKETIISTPDAMGEELLRARTHLVERIAENDDALLERYLAGETIPFEELLESLRTACFERKFVPVLCGSGKTDIGVSLLLDFLVECLPSPMAETPFAPSRDMPWGTKSRYSRVCARRRNRSPLRFLKPR
jgi:elongation factor G